MTRRYVVVEEPRIAWYRTPLDKETLRELLQRSDRKGFQHLIGKLLLVSLTGVGAYWTYSARLPVPVIILAIYVHCTIYTFLGPGGPVHELCHGTVFKTRFWNEFFLRITSFLSWTNYVFFRTSHAKHHQLTVYEGLDLEIILPQKIRWYSWIQLFTIWVEGIRFFMGNNIRHSFGRLKGEWEKRIFPESRPALRKSLFRWARVTLIGHMVLATIFIVTGNWMLIFFVTFAPFIALWLNVMCGFTQHAGLSSSVPDFRLNSRTVILGPVLRFLYSYMNYHVEHHMYAAVPFYNLPRLRKAIEHDLPRANPGLLAAWKEILPILRRQKEDPSYSWVPELPGAGRAAG